jgi:pimeloyl-ACP methyl ester carboxylesterase
MVRSLVRAALILVVLGLAAAWGAGSWLAWPRTGPVPPPAPPGRVIGLVAGDGVHLTGSYWPGARPDGPAVLLLHGVDSSRAAFARHAPWLNQQGFAVLAIDFRGHGGSQAVARSFGLEEARDAAAALAFLRRDAPARRVAVIGTSLGGAAALLGDEGPLPVQEMVLQAVYPDLRDAVANRLAQRLGRPLALVGEPLLSFQSWPRHGVWPGRLAPADAIRRFSGPVLVIGGLDDRSTTPAEIRRLYDAAPGPKSLWLLPATGHAAAGSVFTEAYRARVGAFLRQALGDPRSAGPEPDQPQIGRRAQP